MSEKTDLARIVQSGMTSEAVEALSKLDPNLYYKIAQQAAGKDQFEPQAQTPSRSQMTWKEKQVYISDNGYDAFMALEI